MFLSGVMVGAGCLWLALHPLTRTVASWLHNAGNRVQVYDRQPEGDVGVPPPVVRLAKVTGGVGWKLIVRGKAMTESREETLALLSQVSKYPNLLLSIEADGDLRVETLREAIKDIKSLGFHRFQIQGILWGTTDTNKDGFVY